MKKSRIFLSIFAILFCANFVLAECGNNNLEEGEVCDTLPNICSVNGGLGYQVCRDDCQGYLECQRCGDGVRQGIEACDDGNTEGGDACPSTCLEETSNDNGNDDDDSEPNTPPPALEECEENWQCGIWGECENGLQYRRCVDLNDCGTFIGELPSVRGCVVDPIDKETPAEEMGEVEQSPGLRERAANYMYSVFRKIVDFLGIKNL